MKTNKVQNLTINGSIVSVSGRTAKVRVTKQLFHPIYKKRYTQHVVYLVDIDTKNDVADGDLVTIERTRPLSKRKFWRIKR